MFMNYIVMCIYDMDIHIHAHKYTFIRGDTRMYSDMAFSLVTALLRI